MNGYVSGINSRNTGNRCLLEPLDSWQHADNRDIFVEVAKVLKETG